MLVEQACEGFYLIDYSGKVHDINRWACENLGYSREEFLKMSINQIDIVVDQRGHRKRFWEALGPGQHVAFEGIHMRKNGSTFPVEVRLNRMDIGAERFLLGLTRDISKWKKGAQKPRGPLPGIMALKERLED